MYHIIHLFKVYNLMVFNSWSCAIILTMLKHFYLPKRNFIAISSSSSFTPASQHHPHPQGINTLFSVHTDLPVLEISYVLNHILGAL